MGIVIFNEDKSEKYGIELKYPTNGQLSLQMFSMCRDIKFLEQLKEVRFTQCYSLNLVDVLTFYNGNKNDGIYIKFRDEKNLYGIIEKPIGKSDESFELVNGYQIKWRELKESKKYFLIII